MNYLNRDFYDYISKIDSKIDPLHVVYRKLLKLLKHDGLNNELSANARNAFFELMKVRRFDYEEDNFNELFNLLSYVEGFRRIIKDDHGNYMIYPSLEELPNINDLMMFYSLKKKMNIKEIIEYLNPIIQEKKEEVKKIKFEPYYGDPKYLILRTKAIYDAIVLLKNRDDIIDKNLVEQEYANIEFLLKEMLTVVNLTDEEDVYENLSKFDAKVPISKSKYDILRKLYISVLDCEKSLINVSSILWKNYEETNNGVFVHQLTGDIVESDCMDKICVSFYSDKANVITDYMGGSTGYAYPMDIHKMMCICEGDVGSWKTSIEAYVDRAMPERWQLDGSGMWYEYPHHTKLFPPEYIESKVIEKKHFAEAILDNSGEKIKPLYCFYTAEATEEQIEKITEIADRQGLEVVYLRTHKDKKVTRQV